MIGSDHLLQILLLTSLCDVEHVRIDLGVVLKRMVHLSATSCV